MVEEARTYKKRTGNATDDNTVVERVTCPFCFHHKGFCNTKRGGYKCTRCKRRF